MMHDSPSASYWLYRWIDDNAIRQPGDLHKALRRPSTVDRLLELESTKPQNTNAGHLQGYSVVAGRRIDLSGFLGCPHFECVLPQIDTLFGKTWHYFDTIVIDDPALRNPDSHLFVWDLEQRVRLLLHLRKIGASEHVAFKRKVFGFCQLHFREFAQDKGLGLDLLFDDALADRIAEELLTGAKFVIEKRREVWHYEIYHPKLERIASSFSHSDPEAQPTREEAARDAFGMYCSGLISDVAATRELSLPLLQAADGLFLSDPSQATNEEIVALNLRLPVLMNVPAKEILKLKHDNWPEFERFRSALRVAIKEQMDRAGTKSPEEIANAVIREYLTPELADIERHLGATKRSLARKIGAGVALGGSSVAAGAVASIPLVIGAGIAALATSLPQVYKYFEDKGDVEMSDLYFIWRARVRDKGHRR